MPIEKWGVSDWRKPLMSFFDVAREDLRVIFCDLRCNEPWILFSELDVVDARYGRDLAARAMEEGLIRGVELDPGNVPHFDGDAEVLWYEF